MFKDSFETLSEANGFLLKKTSFGFYPKEVFIKQIN